MKAEIVIVDDDMLVSGLASELLREAGYATTVVTDGPRAEEAIRRERPRLAIVDIMLPGADGIALVKRLKDDPELRDLRVAVVSGKSFPQDKERALKSGADVFIEKPFNTDTFARQVADLIGRPASPAGAAAAPASKLALTVWGCRGDAGGKTSTPCVALDAPGRLIALDAGTGLAELGAGLSGAPLAKELWVVLTHYHPAHVEGLGLFGPASDAGATLKIAGPFDAERGLKAVVHEAFAAPGAAPLRARAELFELREDVYDLAPGVRLACMHAHHPGTTLALSLELEGRKLVYAPDSELLGDAATAYQDYDDKLARFARDADLLIHDAFFADQDAEAKTGHSSIGNALRLGAAASVKELLLFHQNPAYDDARLDALEKEAQAAAARLFPAIRCRMAREGLTINL